jgi:hypothetical protein
MPYKVFAVNEVLTASDMNTYVSKQVISTFAGTAARNAAIGTPTGGQFAFLTDDNSLTFYSTATSTWQTFESGGGVTVGTAAPSTPVNGELWFNSNDGKMYIYYSDGNSSQWVAAIGGFASAINTDNQGVSRIFVGTTDPDIAYTLNIGDVWIVS